MPAFGSLLPARVCWSPQRVRSWAERRALGQYLVRGAPQVASPAAVPPWSEVGDPGKPRELGLVPPVVSKEPGGQCPRCPSWGPSHMPTPRGNSGPSLGHISGEMRVYPAGGAAAGSGIYVVMSDAINISMTKRGDSRGEPHGLLIGLVCGDDLIPDPSEVSWLAPFQETRFTTSRVPGPYGCA